MKNEEKPVRIVYVEPLDYFPKSVRKKCGFGEYAKPKPTAEDGTPKKKKAKSK